MKKRIVLLQNTELWWHLALSTFLTWLLQRYTSSDEYTYDLICGSIEREDQLWSIPQVITVHPLWTQYNKIVDNFRFTRKAFQMLRRLHKEQPIDILHGLYPNSSLQAMVLFKWFVHRKVKLIYDVRSPWIEMSFANAHISYAKWLIRWCMHMSEKILTKRADYFVFISAWTQQYYTEKYALSFSATTVSVIPTGVDVEKFSLNISADEKQAMRNKLGIANTTKIIWYVGSISKMRCMSDYIVSQQDKLKSADICFLMIGAGDDLEDMQAMVDTYWLSEKFIFLGKMPQSDLIPYMHIFDYGWCHLPDIFVFQNSFPLKILEYLAVDMPVVCSDIHAHRVIQDAFPASVSIYADDMLSVWGETWTVDRAKLVADYDWQSLVKKYDTIYSLIVD